MSMLLNEDVALEERLKRTIRGEVRFETGDRSLYATDASNYRYLPIGVVIPKDRKDIIDTVAICRELRVPLVGRGGGTALAGQSTNRVVVMDFSKYFHKVLEINPEERWARVETGVVLDALNKAAEPYNLIVGPDPATHSHCTIGGMLGNNACGIHAQWAGKMEENVLELEVLTVDGDVLRIGATSQEELQEILRKKDRRAQIYHEILKLRDRYGEAIRAHFPHIPRRVSGYNLNEILKENHMNLARALVGSESTLVTILEAKIKLLEKPKARGLIVVGYPAIAEAADDVAKLDRFGAIGLEAVDELLKRHIEEKHLHEEGLAELPEGHAWLFLEFGAESEETLETELTRKLSGIMRVSKKPPEHYKVVVDKKEQELIWKVRESGLGATARNSNNRPAWPGWEDAAIPPEKLGDYLRDFHRLLARYEYKGSLYGHFGQGCVHTRIDFDLLSHQGIEKYHRFIREAARLVASYGGSLSGEHGDGQARGELLNLMYGPEVIEAMTEFKRIWDPLNLMNPGKVVHPHSATDHLRLGEHHLSFTPKTHFPFTDDQGSFAFALQRCVGVGNCRQLEGETMCPSFKVTFEEKHSTRGRAHLLFEMMKKGTPIKLWRDRAVKESLDLCLACKGCKTDCPVSVDMATYKAEFLAHYFKGRPRPLSAYAMGLVFIWARIASVFPRLINFLTHAPVLSAVFKWLGGMAPEREVPRFAERPFRKEFSEKASRGKRVLLWTDTFNNYFHPQVLHSLRDSLEAFGYQVTVARKNLCCGRPLYDYGMLTMARGMLQDILRELREEIEAGTPVIFAEPSCQAVMKDELLQLFPGDEDAKRLALQSLSLAEFLAQEKLDFKLSAPGEKKIIVHGHCHHKALGKKDADNRFLAHFGDGKLLDTGCCGMAGSFGFEKGERYEVSVKVAENDLLKKIDENEDALLVADGFSCREQVKQLRGYYPLHSAELLDRSLKQFPERPS